MSDGGVTIEPGDPRYDGFRITELWAVTSIDPADDQEGLVAIEGPQGQVVSLIASDTERLESLLKPAAEGLRRQGVATELRHFSLSPDRYDLSETVPPSERQDESWQAYVSHVQSTLVPMISEASMSLLITPQVASETDVKFAIELGLSIMMNKPILAFVHPDMDIPPKLEQFADKVIRVDIADPGAAQRIKDEIDVFAGELGLIGEEAL